MKKRLFLYFFCLCIVLLAIWYGIFRPSGRYSIDMAIPSDAIVTIRTPSFQEIYNNLSPNTIWKSLKKYPSFKEYHQNIERIDSLGKTHSNLRKLILDRPFAISVHLTPTTTCDLLYVCDLQKLNMIQNFEALLPGLLKDYGIQIIPQENHIQHLLYGQNIFYYSFKDNLLIGSFNEALVQKALKSCEQHKGEKKKKHPDDISVDINHKELDKWLSTSAIFDSSFTGPSFLDSTSLDFQLKKEEISLSGTTHFLKANSLWPEILQHTTGNASEIKRIIPDNTAAYFSFCFPSFRDLKDSLTYHSQQHYPETYQLYETSLQKLNKYLKIDLLDLFTSWIGSEITLVKPAYDSEQQLQTVVLAVQCKDKNLAKDQLDYLGEQIRIRTPVKFKTINYNGYEINYLSLKGFFRLFAGGLFDRLEKPYYTIIDNYVLFSNSPAALTQIIKKYILGQTLENNEKYKQLISQLNNHSNLYAYLNAANVYRYLYLSLPEQSKPSLLQNKGAVLSFENLALEFVQENGHLKTNIIATHDANAPEEFEIQELNEAFENLADEVESGRYHPVLPDSIVVSTLTDFTYETADLTMKGRLLDGEPNGFWNFYDKQAAFIGQFPYKNGKPDGTARLFYTNQKIRAEITYENGEIRTFREFFPDGTPRTELEYRKGKRQGEAKFYYSTGHLLCEGKYKKGKRTGNWQYYKVTGEIEKKIKF